MKVHYDSKYECWFQTGNDNLTFGGEKKRLIQNRNTSSSSFSFDFRLKNNHVGPLIGILAGRKLDSSLTGNGALFIKLQKALVKHGGLSFVFTTEDAGSGEIKGYLYHPDEEKWLRIKAPYPDVIYNRTPFRRLEEAKSFKVLVQDLKMKDIPFFNPSFIDKYELYLLLNNHPYLKNHLPATILANSKASLTSFLEKFNSIYLKASGSARGKGIFKLNMEEKEQIHLIGNNVVEKYNSIDNFWEARGDLLQSNHYIAQESIAAKTFQGKRFDFRILAHGIHSEYTVTGVGVRQAGIQEITTHIPNGGMVLDYNLVKKKEHDDFIQSAVTHAGKWLSENWGYFGEFSIDAGISETGHYYIYEINSKPMSFDEYDIEENKISSLCRLFFQLAGYKKSFKISPL